MACEESVPSPVLSDCSWGQDGRSDKATAHSSSCSSLFWPKVDMTADWSSTVMLGEMIAKEAIKKSMAIQSKRTLGKALASLHLCPQTIHVIQNY